MPTTLIKISKAFLEIFSLLKHPHHPSSSMFVQQNHPRCIISKRKQPLTPTQSISSRKNLNRKCAYFQDIFQFFRESNSMRVKLIASGILNHSSDILFLQPLFYKLNEILLPDGFCDISRPFYFQVSFMKCNRLCNNLWKMLTKKFLKRKISWLFFLKMETICETLKELFIFSFLKSKFVGIYELFIQFKLSKGRSIINLSFFFIFFFSKDFFFVLTESLKWPGSRILILSWIKLT